MAFGDDAGFTAYLAANGYTLPADALAPAVLRQRGSAYINGVYGLQFAGVPTAGFAQEDSWPRIGAEAYSQPIAADVTPLAVINASYEAGWYEANNAGGLSVAASLAGAIKREKIDVIETEYVVGSGSALSDATVKLLTVEGLLAPFFTGPGIAVFVV